MTQTKAQYGKELATLILEQAQHTQITDDKILSLVTGYFSSRNIGNNKECAKIIQRALVVLHPDKSTLPNLEQTLLITKTLIGIIEHYQEAQESTNLRSKETEDAFETFRRNLLGSVFQNNEMEQLMAYIGYKNPSLMEWLTPKSKQSAINAPIKFMQSVTGYPVRTNDISDMLILLLKIALLEHIINQVHPNKTIDEVIGYFITSEDNYPQECERDPLFWLMNEIVLDNAQPVSKNSQPETTLSTIECPSFIDILNAVLIYKQFLDIASLQNLLQKWKSDNYLPIVKTLLSQLITISAENNKEQNYTNSLVEIAGESVFIIDERSQNILLTFFQFDKASLGNTSKTFTYEYSNSYLNYLESYRHGLIAQIQYVIPSILFSAKFQIKNENETHPVSDYTIGEFLTNRLDLLNFLINQERQSKGLILEDPNFQPVIAACESSVLTYSTSMGVKVPYIHTACSIVNSQRDSLRTKLECKDWLPVSMSPEITSILENTLEIFNIGYRGYTDGFVQFYARRTNPYGALKELFVNCSAELKTSPESKSLLLNFADKAFKTMDPQLYATFSKYVNDYIVVQTPPIELLDFAEGLALFQKIKSSVSNHTMGYKQRDVSNQNSSVSGTGLGLFSSNNNNQTQDKAENSVYKRSWNDI